MGLFSKKLTSTQEAELQEMARTLHTVREQYERALIDMHSEIKDLYSICRQALKEGRELGESEYLLDAVGDYRHPDHLRRIPEERVDANTLIENAKEAIRIFIDSLTDLRAKILSIKPADWYPKKYRKAHDSWDSYFKSILQFTGTAADMLKSPEPLKNDPEHGNSKLNVFAYSLNTIAMLSQELFLPKDL